MTYEDYVATLDPKVAKRLRTAAEVDTIRLPLISKALTNALGGGIGAGRITLCFGNTSSGKSSIFEETIGKIWQPMGLTCMYVDVEGTYEKEWGARLGIDNDKLVFASSRSAGRIEDEIAPHLKAGIDVIVIDSISDILPEVFIGKDGEMADLDGRKQLGAHAKAITALVNGIHYLNERTAVVLLSQTTTKIEQSYVEQVPHGGQKVQFASSQIIKLTSSNTENAQIKGEIARGDNVIDTAIGRKVEWFVKKNKMGKQHGKGTWDFYYAGAEVGVDTIGEALDMAEEYGVVEKKGAWYAYNDAQFQGRNKFVSALKEDEELLSGLKKRLDVAMTGEVSEED